MPLRRRKSANERIEESILAILREDGRLPQLGSCGPLRLVNIRAETSRATRDSFADPFFLKQNEIETRITLEFVAKHYYDESKEPHDS